MFRSDARFHSLLSSPVASVLSYVRTHWTFSYLVRVFLVSLMISLYTFGLWSTVLAPRAAAIAYAASLNAHPAVVTSAPPRRGPHPSGISACPKLPQNQTPPVSQNPAALSGLGDLGAFTFFKWNVDDHATLKVNVVNGNLVMETSQLHIHGTGIDLNIGATYNSLPTAATVDMGAKWNLTVGTGIFLTVNNQTQAVTLHTSTGASVTYFPDSQSKSGYDEPPNMDATLFHNQDGSYTIVFQKTGECFGFNTSGQETYDEDKNTNLITFGYTGSQLSTITDTQNRVTTVQYGPSGRIKSITDPIDRTVQYLYQDGNNNLTDIVDAAGKTTHFVYSGHDLTSITDPLLNVTTIGYQTGDIVTSLQDAFKDQATTLNYYHSGNSACNAITGEPPCTVITDANNGKTTYFPQGLVVQYVFDQLNHKQTNSYTPDNNVTQYTDGLGDNSQLVFDPMNNNNLTGVIDGNKATTSLQYGDSNNPYSPTLQTDPQNNQLTSAYDPSGNRNLLSVKDTTPNGTGSTLTYTYYSDDGSSGNGKGTLKTITDGDGNVTAFAYDQYGNLKTETPQSPLAPQSYVEMA